MTTSLCNWQSCSIPLWVCWFAGICPAETSQEKVWITIIFILIFPLSSFGLMPKKQTHNVIATCFAKPDPLTTILSTPLLNQPRCKACRNCAGLAVTGATGSPTGRGTVGTGCGTACGSGCRTYLCRCPRHLSQPGRRVGVQRGFPDAFPNGWI